MKWNRLEYLQHISRNSSRRRNLDSFETHAKSLLKFRVVDDGIWAIAANNPSKDCVTKFAVRVVDTRDVLIKFLLLRIGNASTRFDVIENIRSCLVAAIAADDDAGIPIKLKH